jgi:hypothetical protein
MNERPATAGLNIQSVDLDGQLIRVGIRRANAALPPLLIFNRAN